MANNRSARLEGEFKRVLADVLRNDVKDPRMSCMVSITRVEITPDLKFAKVYVSIYDTPEKIHDTMDALTSAEGFIRARVNDKIKLRRIPVLSFVHDASIEYSVKMSRLIDEVVKQDAGE